MIASGQVRLEGMTSQTVSHVLIHLAAQDFFEDQPDHVSQKTAVFFLRWITHDWPMAECVKILKKLHAASSSASKVILVEQVVPYACSSPYKFSGMNNLAPPAPLLANLGQAYSDVYTTDFTMAVLLNAQERTVGEFEEMTSAAGWKISQIYQTAGSCLSEIVCEKA